MATPVCDDEKRPSVLYVGQARPEVVGYLRDHGYAVDEFPFRCASPRTKGSSLENDALLVGSFDDNYNEKLWARTLVNAFIIHEKPVVVDFSQRDFCKELVISEGMLKRAGNSFLDNYNPDPEHIHNCLQRVLGRGD